MHPSPADCDNPPLLCTPEEAPPAARLYHDDNDDKTSDTPVDEPRFASSGSSGKRNATPDPAKQPTATHLPSHAYFAALV